MVGTRPKLFPAARTARVSWTVFAILIEFSAGCRSPPSLEYARLHRPRRVGLRSQAPLALEHRFERLSRLLGKMVGLVVGRVIAGEHVAAKRFDGVTDQLRGVAVLAHELGRRTEA